MEGSIQFKERLSLKTCFLLNTPCKMIVLEQILLTEMILNISRFVLFLSPVITMLTDDQGMMAMIVCLLMVIMRDDGHSVI